MVSIHGPLGYEPNTLTTAPLRWMLSQLAVINAFHEHGGSEPFKVTRGEPG